MHVFILIKINCIAKCIYACVMNHKQKCSHMVHRDKWMHQWTKKRRILSSWYLYGRNKNRERKNGINLKPTMKINVFYCERWVFLWACRIFKTRYHREKIENDLDFVFIGAIFISIKHFQWNSRRKNKKKTHTNTVVLINKMRFKISA